MHALGILRYALVNQKNDMLWLINKVLLYLSLDSNQVVQPQKLARGLKYLF